MSAKFYFSVFLSVVTVILFGVWLFHWSDLLESDHDYTYALWHPFLMVISVFIFMLIGSQVMMFLSASGDTVKFIHFLLLSIAGGLMCIGLALIFRYHASNEIHDMYSAHAWIGMAFFVVFGIHWLLGFFSFIFPLIKPNTIRPLHKSLGPALLLMAIAAIVSGVVDRQQLLQRFYGVTDDYSDVMRLGNICAVFSILSGTAALFNFINKGKGGHDNDAALLNN